MHRFLIGCLFVREVFKLVYLYDVCSCSFTSPPASLQNMYPPLFLLTFSSGHTSITPSYLPHLLPTVYNGSLFVQLNFFAI